MTVTTHNEELAAIAQGFCTHARSLGKLEDSVAYGKQALKHLADSNDFRLRIDIECDYAVSCHKLMLWQMLFGGGLAEDPDEPPTYPELQEEAEIYFEGAISLAEEFGTPTQLLVTRGTFGIFLFDVGLYDDLQYSRKERRDYRQRGHQLLRDAVNGLECTNEAQFLPEMRRRLRQFSNPFRRWITRIELGNSVQG
jgi:hypothetical protein